MLILLYVFSTALLQTWYYIGLYILKTYPIDIWKHMDPLCNNKKILCFNTKGNSLLRTKLSRLVSGLNSEFPLYIHLSPIRMVTVACSVDFNGLSDSFHAEKSQIVTVSTVSALNALPGNVFNLIPLHPKKEKKHIPAVLLSMSMYFEDRSSH